MSDQYKKLDLSGWIVLHNLLQPGDEVLIRAGGRQTVFDQDIKATVRKISSNNMLALDNIRDLDDQPLDYPNIGWLDVMWDTWMYDNRPKQVATGGGEE